jgi:hypothetical protein
MSTQAQAVQDFYCYDGAFPAPHFMEIPQVAGRLLPAMKICCSGQHGIALCSGMLFWQEVKKWRFYSHATKIHLIGCLLDCKGWKKNGNHPVVLAESSAAQWFSKSVDLQTIQPPRLLSSWPAAVPKLWPQSHRHWREFGSGQYLEYNVRGWISITIWFDVIICYLILIDIMWPRYTCCLGIPSVCLYVWGQRWFTMTSFHNST